MPATQTTLFADDTLARTPSHADARTLCAGLIAEHARDGMLSATLLPTPLGPMLGVAGDDGVWMLEFVDRARLRTQVASMSQRSRRAAAWGEHPHLRTLGAWVTAYFADPASLPPSPAIARGAGSAFQERVWAELRRIPAGSTCSYAQLAARIGSPLAVRAVAKANATNRVALLTPCHRVIGADGSLTGYAGGVHRKAWLLDHERSLSPSRPPETAC